MSNKNNDNNVIIPPGKHSFEVKGSTFVVDER